jgi:hypothetical protein
LTTALSGFRSSWLIEAKKALLGARNLRELLVCLRQLLGALLHLFVKVRIPDRDGHVAGEGDRQPDVSGRDGVLPAIADQQRPERIAEEREGDPEPGHHPLRLVEGEVLHAQAAVRTADRDGLSRGDDRAGEEVVPARAVGVVKTDGGDAVDQAVLHRAHRDIVRPQQSAGEASDQVQYLVLVESAVRRQPQRVQRLALLHPPLKLGALRFRGSQPIMPILEALDRQGCLVPRLEVLAECAGVRDQHARRAALAPSAEWEYQQVGVREMRDVERELRPEREHLRPEYVERGVDQIAREGNRCGPAISYRVVGAPDVHGATEWEPRREGLRHRLEGTGRVVALMDRKEGGDQFHPAFGGGDEEGNV